MTAIRKLDLQYACFQHLTSKTTEIGYSNDRFGLNTECTKLVKIFLSFERRKIQPFHFYKLNNLAVSSLNNSLGSVVEPPLPR